MMMLNMFFSFVLMLFLKPLKTFVPFALEKREMVVFVQWVRMINMYSCRLALSRFHFPQSHPSIYVPRR
jgi:hypothetical protein